MRSSDTIDSLAAALVKAQHAIPAAPKNATNPHFRNRYADLATLHETAQPALKEHGLAILQTFDEDGEHKGVTINTRVIHESGQWIEGTLRLPVDKPTPQGFGSAITYARRYALAAILNMVSDDDDDGEAAEGRAGNGQQGKAPTAKPKPATKGHIHQIDILIDEAGADRAVVMKHYNVQKLTDLTEAQAVHCINKLTEKRAQARKEEAAA